MSILDNFRKAAADLTAAQRAEIPKKDFALTGKQSNTKKPAYPIHDEKHARLALAFVKMHGSDAQKSEVYKDVARKYPQLAAKSSVTELKSHVKQGTANPSMLRRVGEHLVRHEDPHEIAGLGTLAVPGIDYAQARARALASGDTSPDATKKRRLLGPDASEAVELGGLGYLASPVAAKMIMKRRGIPLPGGHG